MALHGSLDTFALADVLSLLSNTGKKGELHVNGEGKEGRLWVDGGKVVGASGAGTASTPVDVLFDLLRLADGNFDFRSDEEAPEALLPLDLEPLLADAQARLTEWRSIEAVVPSLEATVELVGEIDGDEVRVGASQWRAVVAVARAATVHGVMERLQTAEFETCRTIKDLVDAGLVQVGTAPDLSDLMVGEEPAAEPTDSDQIEDLISIPSRKKKSTKAAGEAPARSADEQPAPAKELEPEEAAKLVKQLTSLTGDAEEAERAVQAYRNGELAEDDGDDPINRGLLLKFLSSVRS